MTPQCHVAEVNVNPIYSLVTNFPTHLALHYPLTSACSTVDICCCSAMSY